ncbi:hypothetical protein CDHC03_2093 [Corynebacterium diphtheriae HC03]|nr:hypothetical protein CDHC03_2093 [Corynebacterium diphtheriae HC03]AEX82112.1 hypothetical protein CDHC04_2123 [Corynebacterium diphtheriae HC04]AEX84283.1 hypothetical protein CDVA01_2019 [Corynebacterium diphtheriae VA01]
MLYDHYANWLANIHALGAMERVMERKKMFHCDLPTPTSVLMDRSGKS